MSKNLNYNNATHLLSCRHAIGLNGYNYYMKCHILKIMSSDKLKILVFGDRYWKNNENKSRIRYVSNERVIKGKYK